MAAASSTEAMRLPAARKRHSSHPPGVVFPFHGMIMHAFMLFEQMDVPQNSLGFRAHPRPTRSSSPSSHPCRSLPIILPSLHVPMPARVAAEPPERLVDVLAALTPTPCPRLGGVRGNQSALPDLHGLRPGAPQGFDLSCDAEESDARRGGVFKPPEKASKTLHASRDSSLLWVEYMLLG